MEKENHFEVVVIGSGSGLTISSEAAEMGLKTAVIENGPFGGTCLNRGCIPSKILIHTADVMESINTAGKFNIKAKIEGFDWKAMQKRVWNHIDPDAKMIEQGNKENENITVFKGNGKFLDKKTLKINDETITSERFFICAGTRPRVPKIPGIDKVKYHTSDDVMRLDNQPKTMTIIGGGFIAAEMAHFFSSIGTKVTLIYRGSQLLRREDKDVSEKFTEIVQKKYNVLLNTNPTKFVDKGKRIVTYYEQGKKKGKINSEVLLIATGRIPNTDILDVEKSGVKINQRKYIEINDYTETNIPGIWAIGDIAGRYMLKHSANLEAGYCANNALTKNKVKIDYHAMPHAVFSSPQIASVGMTEADLEIKKISYVKGVYEYYNTGMGIALEEKEGFCKVLADPKTQNILGCHILGPQASILIHEVLVAMKNKIGTTGITKTVHIHPALSEVVQRAFSNIDWHGQ